MKWNSIIIGSTRCMLHTVLLLIWLIPGLSLQAGTPLHPGNDRVLGAAPPNWSINPLNFEFNMNMIIRVQFQGTNSNAPGNIVGVFVGGELRGVATPTVIGGEMYFYTTVYSNTYNGETLHFQVYYAPNDAVYGTAETSVFLHNGSVGSLGSPFFVNIDPNLDYPPVLSPLLADTTLQTIPFDPVNLVDYLFSADSDPVVWSAQPGPNLNASIVNGVLTVTPVSGAWIGTDSVRIIVTEQTANQLADTITGWFTVLPDYGPPVWQDIPDQTIFQGASFTNFDLDDYLMFNGDCHQFDFDVFPFVGTATDPAWPSVAPGVLPMTVIARPLFADEPVAGAGAKMAGFVNGVLAGWATPVGVLPNISYSMLLANVGSGPITFKVYDAQNQYLYEKTTTLVYASGTTTGTVANPYPVQVSPLVPSISAAGVVNIAIVDTSWLGAYPVDFIVWDCHFPLVRRDSNLAVFSIVNDIQPVITSASAVNFQENACSVLYDTETADPNNSEGAGLTYSLDGGADVLRFSIDPVTGILSWANGFTPDFEIPMDANTDNVYGVNIKVTNAALLSDVLVLSVTITNQLTEPFVATINGQTSSLLCFAGNVSLQAAGGISYLWSNGSTQSSTSVSTAGTYTVIVTSTGACTAVASITIAPPASITASGSGTPVCQGSPIQLGSTPSGGTMPYGFAWSGPNGFMSTLEDPASFPATPAATGVYTVLLTDQAGCTATASTTITVSANAAPTIVANSNSPVCIGSNIVLSSTPSGGTGTNYGFAWTGPNGYSSPSKNPVPFTATLAKAGVYTVIVTDSIGCSGSGTTNVVVNTNPTVTAGSNSPVSVGSLILLNATASGGSGSGYTYSWAGPNGYSSTMANPTGFTAALNTAGVYTVTVTDSNGCIGTGTTTVVVAVCPTITASLGAPVCTGSAISLQSTPTNGALPYASFAWAGPNGYTANVEDPASFPATMAAAGTYTVTVTDALGCSASSTVTVTVYSLPSITAANTGPVCQDASISLSSTPSAGSGTYASFMWTGPDGYGASAEDPAPFSTTLASAGTYQVKVTDSNGCTATATTTVVIHAKPVISVTTNSPVCLGATLNLESNTTSGTGPYSYSWTGPASFVSTQEDPVRTPVILTYAGIYRVTVTDNFGCTGTTTAPVSVTNFVGPTITATSNSPVCSGTNLTLNATPTGGTTPYVAYAWAGPNSFSSTQQNPNPFQVYVNASGTYTVTVTDNKNCKASASVAVVVNGPAVQPTSNSPVCPNTNILLQAGGVGVSYAWAGPNGYTSNQANPPGFTGNASTAGVYTVSVTDANGCTNTGTVSVLVEDTTPPVIVCPANTTVAADANCSGVVGAHAPASVTDNCAANPAVTQSPAASTPLSGHNDVKTVTLTANDGNGNTASCNFTVTLKDVTPPVVVCPANMTVAADANCSGVVGAHSPVSVSDNCTANPAVTQSPVATTVLSGHNDSELVTLGADDGNGNAAFCTFTVTLKDVTPPVIVCPADMTVAADANCSGVVGTHAAVSVSDNCTANPTVTQSPAPSTVLNGHNDFETVTLTADDGNGNTASCNFTVTLKDVTPPVIVCPADMTVAADANCSGVVGTHNPVSVSDNCTANPAVTQSPAPSTVLSGHNDFETVTLTADDGNGNTASCNFTVTLKDVTPPVIVCPANMTVAADANCSGVVGTHSPVSVSDNCTANPTVTQSPAPSTVLSGHNDFETVTLTADDGNGNTASCNFTVTLKDVTPPVIVCPANMTVAADANCSGVVGTHSPVSVSDNCTANPAVTQSPAPSTVLSGHNDFETVTLTADDGNGNTAFCTFTVTLKDVTPPVIVCPTDMTVAADANCSGVVGTHSPVSVSDNCTANPTVSQSPAPSTVLSGHNDFETVTLTADDGNGNTASCTFTVTLKDVTPPVIVCPANTTIAADANCSGVVGTHNPVSVSDNCAANPTVTQSPAPSTVLSGHNDFETVTLTADDGNGNTASCTFTVTLKDITPPTVVCKPFTANLNAAGAASITTADVLQSGADNCGTVNQVSVVPNAFTCGNLGANAVVLTVNDGNGNTATCSAVVTVVDLISPTMVCQSITVPLNAAGSGTITAAQINNGSFDNCTLSTLSVSPSAFTCANLGANTVTLTGTDQSGNSSTCQATVTIVDNIPPTMLCKNATINLNAAGQATLTVPQINNGSFDNCTIATLVLSQTVYTCANIGANTVTLTGTDQSGNSAQCTATVTVVDPILPVALCKNATVNLGANGTVTVLPGAVDNGSSDNCSFTLSLTPATFSCANLGTNIAVLKATDSSGNTKTCTATITVKDVSVPTVLCQNVTLALNTLGQATLTPAQVNNGSFDNCSINTYSLDFTQFNCSDLNTTHIVHLTATDQSGNTASCSAIITVNDNIAPNAICQDVTVVLGPSGTVTVFSAQLAVGSTDNCAVWTYTPVAKTYTAANLGPNNLLITVKDYSNNSSTCTSVVTVKSSVIGPKPAFQMALYPNPSVDDVTLKFELLYPQKFNLQVFDLAGKQTIGQTGMGVEGENTIVLQRKLFMPGMYIISLQVEDGKAQKRLIVR
ncbi:MAG: HYR domain-containing protein [Lewinellaceae bacterium]|nr:HYR domain-containing protein [Lewinellaceae bacterium]